MIGIVSTVEQFEDSTGSVLHGRVLRRVPGVLCYGTQGGQAVMAELTTGSKFDKMTR